MIREASDSQPHLVAGAGVLAGVALLATLDAVAPLGAAVLLAVVVVWFAVPGVVLARGLYGRGFSETAAALLVGPVWGYTLSSLVLLALWVAGVRGMTLLAAPIGAAFIAAAVGWVLRGSLVPPRFGRRDLVVVLLVLLVIPLVVARPYSRVGEPTPDGRSYRAYFTADFVWRMAVTAEVSKGEVPPRNPFLRGAPLNYYWLAHLLPAAEHRILKERVSLEGILLVHSVALNVAFVLFLYGFVRQWVDSPTAAAAGCVGALLFTSFEGTERLWALWRLGAPIDSVRSLNIDAVTRWIYGSLPIDGLHRLLLYQPHHSTGYALGLSALLALAQARRPERPGTMLLLGSLLAGCVLMSTFSAVMLTAAVALTAAVRLIGERHWKAMPLAALAGAVPLVLAVAVALLVRYVDRSEALVRLMINPLAATNTLPAIVLSFGPMLAGGLAGAGLALRRPHPSLVPVSALVLVSIVFYFFVDVVDHQFVYVGWRAGHLLFVAFAVLTGYAIQELVRSGRLLRRATWAAAAVLALLAAPTLAIDLYNTQDIDNWGMAAGFRWTLNLTPHELEALQWIRESTPADAIVQVDPFPRATETWAYVPAFAERRMAAGLPISMVPVAKYVAASERVREMYEAPTPEELYLRARTLRIEYLIVGPPEHGAHPRLRELVVSRPDLFLEAFRAGGIAVYAVQDAGLPRTRDH